MRPTPPCCDPTCRTTGTRATGGFSPSPDGSVPKPLTAPSRSSSRCPQSKRRNGSGCPLWIPKRGWFSMSEADGYGVVSRRLLLRGGVLAGGLAFAGGTQILLPAAASAAVAQPTIFTTDE